MSDVCRDVSVVVLAGGRGDRLRPLTDVLPKVLLPLGHGTVLDYLLDLVSEAGAEDVHLMLGRHAALVQAYLQVRNGRHQRLTLTLHTDTHELGTAGPLRAVQGRSGPWLVLNGDLATDVPLLDVLHAHRESGADVTVVGVDYPVSIPFGVLRLDDGLRIQEVVEKPVIHNMVSAGINVIGENARRRLGCGGAVDMTELIFQCVADGLEVRVYPVRAEWFDVGSAADYAGALRAWDERCAYRPGVDNA